MGVNSTAEERVGVNSTVEEREWGCKLYGRREERERVGVRGR